MTSVANLVVGRVCFTVDYLPDDTDLRCPNVRSWIYVGTDLAGKAQGLHWFQSVESYFDAGDWTTLSDEVRSALAPNHVIRCAADELGLICDHAELCDQIAEAERRLRRR